MSRQVSRTEIYDLLYRLGAEANDTGFFYTSCAVALCVSEPDRLLLVTKWLYPEVARQYRTDWRSVEQGIWAVGCVIWQKNRPLLERLACKPLECQPCTTQLLDILSASLRVPVPAWGAACSRLDPGAGE